MNLVTSIFGIFPEKFRSSGACTISLTKYIHHVTLLSINTALYTYIYICINT